MIKIKVAPVGLRRLIHYFKINVHLNFSFIWYQRGLEAKITNISPSNTLASLAQNSYTAQGLISYEN